MHYRYLLFILLLYMLLLFIQNCFVSLLYLFIHALSLYLINIIVLTLYLIVFHPLFKRAVCLNMHTGCLIVELYIIFECFLLLLRSENE